MGLLEVTSGKYLCLTHFTAYSYLTSDFLTDHQIFVQLYAFMDLRTEYEVL